MEGAAQMPPADVFSGPRTSATKSGQSRSEGVMNPLSVTVHAIPMVLVAEEEEEPGLAREMTEELQAVE